MQRRWSKVQPLHRNSATLIHFSSVLVFTQAARCSMLSCLAWMSFGKHRLLIPFGRFETTTNNNNNNNLHHHHHHHQLLSYCSMDKNKQSREIEIEGHVHYNHTVPSKYPRWTARESFQFMYERPWQPVNDFYFNIVRGTLSLPVLFPSQVHLHFCFNISP